MSALVLSQRDVGSAALRTVAPHDPGIIIVSSISLAPAAGLGGGGAGDVGAAPVVEGEDALTAGVGPRHGHTPASLGSSEKLIMQVQVLLELTKSRS